MTEKTSQDVAESSRGSLRTLILGSYGQLGRELQHVFTGFGSITAADRDTVDLGQPDQLRSFIRRVQPDVILNAAAYTAVDRAESEPQLAQSINAEAPGILAEEAARVHALLVHYSTDYVFDGAKQEPWVETDQPHPLNVYGASKLAGERAIQKVGGEFLILRTSWVFGPCGNNFLLTMLRLGRERGRLTVVDDQVGAPTSTIGLARATQMIVGGVMSGRFGAAYEWAGLYHITCAGSTSWFGFAQEIFSRSEELIGLKAPELDPVASKDYPTPAQRPLNSLLSNAKLIDRFGLQLPSWQRALDEVLEVIRSQSAP